MPTKTDSPIQDAVVAFCCLVRALKVENREWARECQEALRRNGFDVRVKRNNHGRGKPEARNAKA